MNKIWILLLPLVLLMTACGEEDSDDEDVEDIRLMHRNTDDVTEGSVDTSKLYDFVLTADDTSYTIEGEINDVKITGNRNTVTVAEGGSFDKLVITGDNNAIDNGTTNTTVDTLIITGSTNSVFLGGATTIINTGSGNTGLGEDVDETN